MTRILRAIILALLLLAISFSVAAQSGRAPTPSPTATPSVKPKFTVDRNADQYLLVVPTNFDGVFRKGKLFYNWEEYRLALPSILNSFINEVNAAGNRGYHLVASRGGYYGLLKLDSVQYEYGWFLSLWKDFEWAYAPQAKRGLHLVNHSLVDENCYSEGPGHATFCRPTYLSLLERVKGEEQPVEHFLLVSDEKPQVELPPKITQNVSEGLFPSCVIGGLFLFFEKSERNSAIWIDKPEVKVLANVTRTLERQINALAREGYRLALIDQTTAILYRPRQPAPTVSYIAVDARKKDFPERLAQLQTEGARYVMGYRGHSESGDKIKLIFEQPAVAEGQRYEYQVLKFDTKEEPDPMTPNKVVSKLTPESVEAMKQLNRLATEGFVVRDLFLSDMTSVLLERKR